jgi:cytochrome P450
MLLEAKYEDGTSMPTELVMDELITLFTAGHETTSNALTWTFYLLAKHPEIQANLHQELDRVLGKQNAQFEHLSDLKYTEMVVKESMRLLPPVWTLNNRQANEDITINGYHIPKGKVLFLSPYANHMNPRYFSQPENFNPDRFSPENEKTIPKHAYIPFGSGPRVCIGQSFAMMEAKIILATIMRKFEVELDESNEFAPQAFITLSNKDGMKVKLKSRS